MNAHRFTCVTIATALVIPLKEVTTKGTVMMTPDMMAKVRKSLVLHEGYKKFPYFDTAVPPKITIGIGYNLTDRGLDDGWINNQFNADVSYFYNQLCTFPWYQKLNVDRQIVLIDMCFMGWKRFLGFHELIAALEMGDYKKAAFEMLNSEWAHEVKTRAATLAQGMLTGVYNP